MGLFSIMMSSWNHPLTNVPTYSTILRHACTACGYTLTHYIITKRFEYILSLREKPCPTFKMNISV